MNLLLPANIDPHEKRVHSIKEIVIKTYSNKTFFFIKHEYAWIHIHDILNGNCFNEVVHSMVRSFHKVKKK